MRIVGPDGCTYELTDISARVERKRFASPYAYACREVFAFQFCRLLRHVTVGNTVVVDWNKDWTRLDSFQLTPCSPEGCCECEAAAAAATRWALLLTLEHAAAVFTDDEWEDYMKMMRG